MRTIGKLVLAFSLVNLFAALAWSQDGGLGGGMLRGGESMLSNKGVQRELKATGEQASKLDALVAEMFRTERAQRPQLQDLPEDQRLKRAQELRERRQDDLHAKLIGVLTPEQIVRFAQIQIQQSGASAFARPRVQKALKLSDEQKTKLEAIQEEMRQASNRIVLASVGHDRSGKQEAANKVSDLRERAFEQAYAQLTDSQKAIYKGLIGRRIEVKFEPPAP